MRRMKFDVLMMLLTFVLSATVCAVCLLVKDFWVEDDIGKIIFSGAFFALPLVFSLTGICISEAVRGRRMVIHRKGNRIVSFIVAMAVAFGIGASGQWAFNFTNPEKQEKTEIIITEKVKAMDICIVFDVSGTMSDLVAECKDAMCTLVDGLETGHRLQVIAFGTYVNICCNMIELTDDNRDYIKNIIQNAGAEGTGSNFKVALENAYKSLTKDSDEERTKTVIVVSDSVVNDISLYNDIKQNYLDAGIKVNSILRFLYGENDDTFERFVKETGGLSTRIEAGSIDTDKLLETLKIIYEKTQEKKVEESTKDIVYTTPLFPCAKDDIGIVKILIRFVLYILYALLATWVMYYSISLSSVIYAVCAALVCALLLQVTGESAIFTPIVYAVLFLTAFTGYYPTYRGD